MFFDSIITISHLSIFQATKNKTTRPAKRFLNLMEVLLQFAGGCAIALVTDGSRYGDGDCPLPPR